MNLYLCTRDVCSDVNVNIHTSPRLDKTHLTRPARAPAALAVCFQAAVKLGELELLQLSVTQPTCLHAVTQPPNIAAFCGSR